MSTDEVHALHARDNEANSAARSDAVAAAIIAAMPDAGGLTVLDYGCGASGAVGLRLTDHFRQVVLADSDPEAVAQVSRVAADRSNVTVRLLDLTGEVPDDLRVDVVVSCLSWHHVTDLGALLVTLPQIAGGGRLFVIDMDDDGGAYHSADPQHAGIRGFVRPELVQLVTRHGYGDVRVADLWRGSKWIAGRSVAMSLFWLQARIPPA